MIFVTLGSQKFQFNRLLKELDRLVKNGTIKEEIFAQTGYSDYIPQNYNFKNFLDRDEFSKVMNKCDKVITHGGTGAIIGAIKKNKKVITIPREKRYGEHVDNHQIQICSTFDSLNLVKVVFNINNLSEILVKLSEFKPNNYISNTESIIKDIENFIKI